MKPVLAALTLLLLTTLNYSAQAQKTKTAVFAGGCFWCMEKPFDVTDGVISTISGYSGGTLENPTYKQVTAGGTGHYEVLQVTYDPSLVSYEDLLEIFWANIDPMDDGGQFCDRGHSYKSAIFVSNEEERGLAEASKEKLMAMFKNEIVTPVIDSAPFYAAEDYHQDYYQKNPNRYSFYRWRCGRDDRLKEIWQNDAGKRIELFN